MSNLDYEIREMNSPVAAVAEVVWEVVMAVVEVPVAAVVGVVVVVVASVLR